MTNVREFTLGSSNAVRPRVAKIAPYASQEARRFRSEEDFLTATAVALHVAKCDPFQDITSVSVHMLIFQCSSWRASMSTPPVAYRTSPKMPNLARRYLAPA